jgi:hypothetical protein
LFVLIVLCVWLVVCLVVTVCQDAALELPPVVRVLQPPPAAAAAPVAPPVAPVARALSPAEVKTVVLRCVCYYNQTNKHHSVVLLAVCAHWRPRARALWPRDTFSAFPVQVGNSEYEEKEKHCLTFLFLFVLCRLARGWRGVRSMRGEVPQGTPAGPGLKEHVFECCSDVVCDCDENDIHSRVLFVVC